MIIAPAIIQPDSIYSAIVTVGEYSPLDKVDVKLSLFKNGADIQGTSKVVSAGTADLLKISVSYTISVSRVANWY